MAKKEGGEEGLRRLLWKHYPGLAPERRGKLKDGRVSGQFCQIWQRHICSFF